MSALFQIYIYDNSYSLFSEAKTSPTKIHTKCSPMDPPIHLSTVTSTL